ncbi:MAG: HD domain-containing protein [Christensenellales bacterium]
MKDERPSEYFKQLVRDNLFPKEYPFHLLTGLSNIPQSPVYHPEGNVWNHTMLVVDNAAQRKHLSQHPRILMWAALLHDFGKISQTKQRKGKITSYDHDKAGQILARKFLKECGQEETFIKEVSALVRWHMQVLFVVKNLPFSDLAQMTSEADINEVALLSFCDRLGRGDLTDENIKNELDNIKLFLKKCKKYQKRL